MLKTEALIEVANIRQGALKYLANIMDTDSLFHLQMGYREKIDACSELIILVNKGELGPQTRLLALQIGLDGLYCDNCHRLNINKPSFVVDNVSICEDCYDSSNTCKLCENSTLNEDYCDDCNNLLIECERCCDNVFKTVEIDGYDVCEECESKAYNCLCCGNLTFHDNQLCHDCQEMVVCDSCDDWVRMRDTYTVVNGDAICESCYDNYYGFCENCREIFHLDDLVSRDNRYYCENCDEGDTPTEKINYYIDSYEYNKSFKGPGKSFNFGIEIEMNEFNDRVEIPDGWGVHYDCTTESEKEIVSPILTLEILRNDSEVDDLFESIKDFPVSTKESLHIHIGNFIDYAHAMNFTALAIESSHIWHTKLCSGSRQENTYCSFREKGSCETVNMRSYRSDISAYGNRYLDVNTRAWEKHRTIEIRAHQATMSKQKTILWAELWEAFWEYSKTRASFPHICKSIKDMCEMLDIPNDEYLKRSLVLGRIDKEREPIIPEIYIKRTGNSSGYIRIDSGVEDWSVENWSRSIKRSYESAFVDLSTIEWFKLNVKTAESLSDVYDICGNVFEHMSNSKPIDFDWHGLPLVLKPINYERKFKLEVR